MSASKARREAATLFLVVFLLGVVLGAFGARLWTGHYSVQAVTQQPPQGPPHKGGPSRDEIVNNFTRELELTPDQQQKIGSMVDEMQAKVRAAYAPADTQREQIRKESREHIRAILTPEQAVKFDDFMRRLDEQRRKDAH